EQYADRTDERGFLRHNMFGGEGGDVGAGCREAIDDDHHRFLALQIAQRIKELFGAGRGPARTVDMYDDRARGGTTEPPQGFDPILISPDQTLHLDPRDIGAGRRETAAWHEQPNCAGNGKEGYHQRADTPKCKLTPYTATIDDGVGIERHDFAPSIKSILTVRAGFFSVIR